MPIELATEGVLKALGQTVGNVAGGATVGGVQQAAPASTLTLNITSKVIDLVSKHADRILDRYNPAKEPTPKVTGKQMLELEKGKGKGKGKGKSGDSAAEQKSIEEKKPNTIKGIEVIEAFEVFIGLQDQAITLAQFGLWLDKNKVKLADAIDKIITKI